MEMKNHNSLPDVDREVQYVRACLAAPITVATRHSARTCHCIGA